MMTNMEFTAQSRMQWLYALGTPIAYPYTMVIVTSQKTMFTFARSDLLMRTAPNHAFMRKVYDISRIFLSPIGR